MKNVHSFIHSFSLPAAPCNSEVEKKKKKNVIQLTPMSQIHTIYVILIKEICLALCF